MVGGVPCTTPPPTNPPSPSQSFGYTPVRKISNHFAARTKKPKPTTKDNFYFLYILYHYVIIMSCYMRRLLLSALCHCSVFMLCYDKAMTFILDFYITRYLLRYFVTRFLFAAFLITLL